MTRVAGSTGHLADHNRWDQFIDDVENGVITVGPAGPQGPQGVPGAEAEVPIVFNRNSVIAVTTGTVGYPVPYNCTVLGVRGYMGTAPVGAAAIFDVNRNGVTIFGTQALRPQAAAGSNTVAETTGMTVTSLTAGDVLTVDVDQVGSTTAGSDLTLVIRIRKA